MPHLLVLNAGLPYMPQASAVSGFDPHKAVCLSDHTALLALSPQVAGGPALTALCYAGCLAAFTAATATTGAATVATAGAAGVPGVALLVLYQTTYAACMAGCTAAVVAPTP